MAALEQQQALLTATARLLQGPQAADQRVAAAADQIGAVGSGALVRSLDLRGIGIQGDLLYGLVMPRT
ncbi:MAG: hypothetical protein VKJ44_04480 [Synechococcus sp.]|nr:hypothetical protein [Synechococcus sp.]